MTAPVVRQVDFSTVRPSFVILFRDVILIGNPGTDKTFPANCIAGAASQTFVRAPKFDLAVYFLTMTDWDSKHDQDVILDLIDHAVVSYSDSVENPI